jgi:hypothetical protein
MARPAPEFPPESELEHESAATLLGRLVSDFAELVRNEVALAKAELAESTARAKSGIGALIGAVATLLAGSLAIVAATLIVGVAITIVGFLLLHGARKKLVPPHIEIDRTRTAVRQDVEVIARRT